MTCEGDDVHVFSGRTNWVGGKDGEPINSSMPEGSAYTYAAKTRDGREVVVMRETMGRHGCAHYAIQPAPEEEA